MEDMKEMPNITIYINDESYSSYLDLSEPQQAVLRQEAKESILKSLKSLNMARKGA